MEIFRVNEAGTLLVSGAIDDWAFVMGEGIDAIVDMDGDVDPGLPEVPNQILYVYFPILDEELPDLRKLDALGRLVASLVEQGHAVLIHCRMGFNRSNLVAATALTYLGRTGESALELIRARRPGALFNEAFAFHVRSLPARRLRVETVEAE
jgi:protein-tyrosine phosphatase